MSLILAMSIDRWAKAHAMLRDVRESIVIFAEEVGLVKKTATILWLQFS